MKKLKHILMVALGCAMLFPSCEKDAAAEFNYPRLFSPIQLSIDAKYDILEGGMITVSWLKRDSAVSYTLELYKDSMLFLPENLIARREYPRTQDTAIFYGMESSTAYSVRLRANAADESQTSKYNELASVIPAENIFINEYVNGVNPDSVTDVSAWIRWFGGLSPVTKLTYRYSGGSTEEHIVTADEQSASLANLLSLANGKLYTVTAYNGEAVRGSVTFRTADIYLATPGDFTSSIALVPDGGMLAMGEGEFTYASSTSLPAQSITFKGIRGKTIIRRAATSTTSTMIKLPQESTPITIKFENLILTGANDGGAKSAYILNEDAACAVSKLWFEGCTISSYENTPMRFQIAGKKVIDSLVVNGCIVTDIATGSQNYAFIHNSATDSAVINNIVISNTTMYNTGLGIIQHDKADSKSVVLSNCTFNDMLKADTRYMITYGSTGGSSGAGFDVTGGIQVSSCIFSKIKNATGARGIVTGTSTTVQTTGSYKTSDYDDAVGSTADRSYAIPDLTVYSGTADQLFSNPSAGDFTILDNSFRGRNSAGDPRWR